MSGSSSASGRRPGVRRLAVLLRCDLRLQRRFGLVAAGLVVACLWVLLLRLLPPPARAVAAPLVVFGDLAVVGYFFAGGLVLFEKAEGTLAALAVTPLHRVEFLLARTLSLTLLALVLTVVVVVGGVGGGAGAGLLALGVLLCSGVAVLVGLAVVAPFDSVSRYLLPAVVPLLVLGLPLLDAAGLLPGPLVALLPTGGAWLALDAAFGGQPSAPLAAGAACNAAWAVAAAALAARAHRRHLSGPAPAGA